MRASVTPASVMPLGGTATSSLATWSLLEIQRPGCAAEPIGVLLIASDSDQLTLRLREAADFADELPEPEADILEFLAADLKAKAKEKGAQALLAEFEGSLSGFFRIGERTAIEYTGSPQRAADRLFDQHVDATVRPFVTHLPLYGLRAAATKFGEEMAGQTEEGEADGWVRMPPRMRLSGDMFVAQVTGRSMEPLIPDGSYCVFRAPVTGSRQGRRLLIEQPGQTDFANRYTVKRYTSRKQVRDDETGGEWEHTAIRLEPLNPEFEAFELSPDRFRVVAEFVEVLDNQI